MESAVRSLNTFALMSMPGFINTSAGPQVWHWVLFIVIVGMLAMLVIPAILKWQRQRARKTVHLELVNEGNTRSRYALHAAEPTGSLAFHFRVNGKPLPEQVVSVVSRQSSAISGQRAAGSQKAAPAKSGGANVQKTLSGAAQTGGMVAGLLATLGRLLPGAAGQSLTGMGREVRQGQQTATQVKQVSQYAGKLQPKAGGSNQPSAVSGQPSAVSRQPSAVSGQSAVGSGQRDVGNAVIEIWAQTPFVEPGHRMQIELQIQPAKPYQTRHYPYILKSRSLEYKEAPVITEEETVLFEALNPFEHFAPFMLFVAGVMILLILFLSLW